MDNAENVEVEQKRTHFADRLVSGLKGGNTNYRLACAQTTSRLLSGEHGVVWGRAFYLANIRAAVVEVLKGAGIDEASAKCLVEILVAMDKKADLLDIAKNAPAPTARKAAFGYLALMDLDAELGLALESWLIQQVDEATDLALRVHALQALASRLDRTV